MTASTFISSLNSQDHSIVSKKSLATGQKCFPSLGLPTQTILDSEKFFSSEEEEDYDDFTEVVCACGKALLSDWNCDGCRISCPTCNRALLPEEECSRCIRHISSKTL